jgi:hypothetical protein
MEIRDVRHLQFRNGKPAVVFTVDFDGITVKGFRVFDGKIHPPLIKVGKQGTYVAVLTMTDPKATELYRTLIEKDIDGLSLNAEAGAVGPLVKELS